MFSITLVMSREVVDVFVNISLIIVDWPWFISYAFSFPTITKKFLRFPKFYQKNYYILDKIWNHLFISLNSEWREESWFSIPVNHPFWTLIFNLFLLSVGCDFINQIFNEPEIIQKFFVPNLLEISKIYDQMITKISTIICCWLLQMNIY
jgi:hypothetical protein